MLIHSPTVKQIVLEVSIIHCPRCVFVTAVAVHESIDPITLIFIAAIRVGYFPSPMLEPAFPLTYSAQYSKIPPTIMR